MKLRRILILILMIVFIGWIVYFFILPTMEVKGVYEVPGLVGLTEEESKIILEDKKIAYEVLYEESSSSGLVIKTDPKKGSVIKNDEILKLYVSIQAKEELIDFTGMSYDDVKNIISHYEKDYGIRVRIEKVLNNDVDENIILNQSEKDKKLEQIEEITLYVSYQENFVAMPSFVGRSINEAYSFCLKNGLLIEAIYSDLPYPTDTIIYQITKENTMLRINSHDVLIFYVAK